MKTKKPQDLFQESIVSNTRFLGLCLFYILIKFFRSCSCNLLYGTIMPYLLKIVDCFAPFVTYFRILASKKHIKNDNLKQALIITQF